MAPGRGGASPGKPVAWSPASVKRQKAVCLWLNCAAILIASVMVGVQVMSGDRITNEDVYYFRLFHYTVYDLMFIIALAWRFLRKTGTLFILVTGILAPLIPTQAWLSNGCNIERTGSAFFFSFIGLAVMFAAGCSRIKIVFSMATCVVVALVFYVLHFIHLQSNGYYVQAPWCPLSAVESTMTSSLQVLAMTLAVLSIQFCAFHLFVSELLKHQVPLHHCPFLHPHSLTPLCPLLPPSLPGYVPSLPPVSWHRSPVNQGHPDSQHSDSPA